MSGPELHVPLPDFHSLLQFGFFDLLGFDPVVRHQLGRLFVLQPRPLLLELHLKRAGPLNSLPLPAPLVCAHCHLCILLVTSLLGLPLHDSLLVLLLLGELFAGAVNHSLPDRQFLLEPISFELLPAEGKSFLLREVRGDLRVFLFSLPLELEVQLFQVPVGQLHFFHGHLGLHHAPSRLVRVLLDVLLGFLQDEFALDFLLPESLDVRCLHLGELLLLHRSVVPALFFALLSLIRVLLLALLKLFHHDLVVLSVVLSRPSGADLLLLDLLAAVCQHVRVELARPQALHLVCLLVEDAVRPLD
mmetsp:Transcript_6276/g.18340  ORF Transcript_6276/g.18340 Transcript_6276/m.18340 type:complete len:303 (+) Transcript_6276:385-1293(+)